MNRLLMAWIAVLAITLPAATRADGPESYDIRSLTCADFTETEFIVRRFGAPQRQVIASLMTGYVMAKQDMNEISTEGMLHIGDMLDDACRQGEFGDRPMLEAMLENIAENEDDSKGQ